MIFVVFTKNYPKKCAANILLSKMIFGSFLGFRGSFFHFFSLWSPFCDFLYDKPLLEAFEHSGGDFWRESLDFREL